MANRSFHARKGVYLICDEEIRSVLNHISKLAALHASDSSLLRGCFLAVNDSRHCFRVTCVRSSVCQCHGVVTFHDSVT